MTEKRKKKRIPDFKNVEEEAEFWDTHSFADHKDEFKPIQAKFAPSLSEPVSFRLDSETLYRLRAIARDMGIGPTTLVRMWVLERLKTFEQHE